MDGKIEQRVCMKFFVKLGKSAIKSLEMFRESLGELSSSHTAVSEWHSHFKAGRVSVENDKRSWRPSISKTRESVEKIRNSSKKTVVKQTMNSQTPLESVMEFARRY
jgi:hypothetical protein